ncbi:MAG: MFS transporter [Verrucomicrobiota bacterium]
MVALLFLLAVLNNLDRQALSVLAPTLREALGFTMIEYSYMVTSFLVAYGLGFFFCGGIIDRVGVRLAVTGALAAWSLAGMMHAMAASWIALAVYRFLLGLGESFNAPCGVKGVAEWIPKRERGLCTSIVSNGNVVGAIIAPPLVSLIALRYGWEWSFLITGAFGFVFLIAWLAFYDAPERQRRLRSEERDAIMADRGDAVRRPAISVWSALAQPACIGFLVARFFTDSLSFFFSFWLPEYLKAAHGFSLAMIGFFAWIPFLAAGIGGPGGGALSDWLIRRGWKPIEARRRMLLLVACIMPLSIVAVHVTSPVFAIAIIGVLLAAQSCWFANLFTLMSEYFPREHMATYVGLSGVGGTIGGIISTLAAGKIIQTIGYVPVFTCLGFLHLLGLLSIHIFSKRQQRNNAGLVAACSALGPEPRQEGGREGTAPIAHESRGSNASLRGGFARSMP